MCSTHGYYGSTHGYYGTTGYYGYYGYYGTINGYYTVPMGTMKYPKRGTMGTTSLSTQHKV